MPLLPQGFMMPSGTAQFAVQGTPVRISHSGDQGVGPQLVQIMLMMTTWRNCPSRDFSLLKIRLESSLLSFNP